MARLEPLTEESKQFSADIKIPTSGLTLGRSLAAPACLALPVQWLQCSGKHCSFYLKEGNWFIQDLSRNGTLVNKARLGRSVTKQLAHGDEITVSQTTAATSAIHVMWKFVLESEDEAVNGPQGNARLATPAASSATKRKSNEPSPNVEKRKRTSDAQTDWVVKHARLLKQLEAQSETHWKELAEVKEQATLKEKDLIAKTEALTDQLKTAQSKVTVANEAAKHETQAKASEEQMLQIQQQLKHLERQHRGVIAERDNLVLDLKNAQANLQAAVGETDQLKLVLKEKEDKSNAEFTAQSVKLQEAEASLADAKQRHKKETAAMAEDASAALDKAKTQAEAAAQRAKADHEAMQERAHEMKGKAQMAEARVENLRSQLEMKEDIAREIKAAFDRQNALDATAASRAAEHLSSLKAAEHHEAERRKLFAEHLEGLEKENKLVAAESEAEIAEQKADLARLLACALGDSLSGYETQAQQETGPLEANRMEVDEVGDEHTQPEAVQMDTKPRTATPANSPRSKASSNLSASEKRQQSLGTGDDSSPSRLPSTHEALSESEKAEQNRQNPQVSGGSGDDDMLDHATATLIQQASNPEQKLGSPRSTRMKENQPPWSVGNAHITGSQKQAQPRAPSSQLLPSSEVEGSQGSQGHLGHKQSFGLEDSALPDKAVAIGDLVKGQTCQESGQF